MEEEAIYLSLNNDLTQLAARVYSELKINHKFIILAATGLGSEDYGPWVIVICSKLTGPRLVRSLFVCKFYPAGEQLYKHINVIRFN